MSLRAIIQFLILIVSVAFEAVREGQGQVQLFAFSDQFEWLRSYIYYVCEHCIFISMCFLLWHQPNENEYKTDKLFTALAVLDFLDYILRGNNLWWCYKITAKSEGFYFIFPISMNVVGLIVFGLYAFYLWATNGERQSE